MDFNLQDIEDVSVDFGAAIIGYFSNPFALYQIGFILIAYLASLFLARRVEPLLEARARDIKGNPRLLRVIVAVMRRTEWIFFSFLLWLAMTIGRQVTWPSRTYLLSIALYLSIAWFVIAVLTRIIRNRFVARSIALIAWTFAALSILGLADEGREALDTLALEMGDFRLSAWVVLKAVFVTAALVWLAVFIGSSIESRLKRSTDLTPSLQVLIGKFVKIGLVIFAGAIALSVAGIDLTALTVFSGAVGVGIGFGLQKVVSNFISGIIILLDKSIKPGDTITLGDTFGWIRELRARFVSVITRDGREFLIPNEDFITTEVINWSFTDKLVRQDVHFGVSYESDPHEVIRLSKEAAATVERVVGTRPIVCWMTEFGDSSINFILRFWISDPQKGLTNVRGQVLLALWDAFKEAGVNIPFPHREIIMRTPVEFRRASDSSKQKLQPSVVEDQATEKAPQIPDTDASSDLSGPA